MTNIENLIFLVFPSVLRSPGNGDEVRVQGCYSAPAPVRHRATTAALEEAAGWNLTLPHTSHVSLGTLQTGSCSAHNVIAALPVRYGGCGRAGGTAASARPRPWATWAGAPEH